MADKIKTIALELVMAISIAMIVMVVLDIWTRNAEATIGGFSSGVLFFCTLRYRAINRRLANN